MEGQLIVKCCSNIELALFSSTITNEPKINFYLIKSILNDE